MQKANLARIRDNQRRSRARRKEYLQELEAKYRQCEQLGVNATAEMQAAARKVLEENRKLRALLKSRGVSNDDIDAAVGVDPDWAEEGLPPSEKLSNALQSRKPCCPGGGIEDELGARGGSDSVVTSPALGAKLQLQQPLSAGLHQQTLSAGLHAPPQMASLSLNAGPLSPQQGVSPMTGPEMTFPSVYHQPSQTYNHGPSPSSTNFSYSYPATAQWQPYESQGHHPAQAIPNYGNTSCVDAANIIRNMRAGVGAELEADLGCQQPGTNCKVENMVVFDVMEKYTSQPTDTWK